MGTGSGGPVPLEVGCVGLSLHESRRQGWAHGVPSLALKQHPHDVFSTFFFFFCIYFGVRRAYVSSGQRADLSVDLPVL